MVQKLDIYRESMRYIENAKDILSTKAKKTGNYYEDAKYVRMASNTAYSGVLLALDGLFEYRGILRTQKKGKIRDAVDVKWYKENIAKMNESMLKKFNSAYNHLHLLGGYDGELYYPTIKTGIDLAVEIIEWVKKQTAKK
jgi:hypothetical protein